MKKYRRLIKLLLVIIFLLLIVFLCVHFLSKGYNNSYTIDRFKVHEVYTIREKNEHDNYYIEISVDNLKFNYQFYYNFKDNNKLVKDITYYDGEYKCLLPTLANDIKVDFNCFKDNFYYNYQDIIGEDEDLDNFINNLSKDIYNTDNFVDHKTNEQEKERLTYYQDNIPNNYVISLSTLKGIITLNNGDVTTTDIFDMDSYERPLSLYYKNYYISADYIERQSFRNIYIVNLLNSDTKIVKAPDYISFNSYIQGVIEDNVYIYDMTNEKQYKLDLSNNKITMIGNANKGIKYYNGNWDYISILKANSILLFTNTTEVYDNYSSFDKQGNKLSGFYYFYQQEDDNYKVYRSNVQDKNRLKYLFTVSDYDDIVFIEDYVFYKDKDSIKMYSDYTGIKTIITNSELEFNNNIIFGVYKNG